MTAIITAAISAATTTPLLVFPWSTTQQSPTILTDILGRANPHVSLAAARSREGTLELFYSSETNSNAARIMLARADTFTLAYPARPSLAMVFVVHGDIEVQLDTTTSDHWVVRFQYRELQP
jgi:redox-sensitive bicupin YhaK (pirin superfamily)